MQHPTRACLAEIVVTDPAGVQSRGSGYRVAADWVLTATHVVHGAARITVGFGAPSELRAEERYEVNADDIRSKPQMDLALLPVPASTAPRGFVPPLFGALNRDSEVEVPSVAAGFPFFKLRPAPGREGVLLREEHYATALMVGGSNLKTGTLAFSVSSPPPERHPDPERSPWEGMSGAPVFAFGHLIGVVGQHYLREGPGTLTVRPLQLPASNDLSIPPEELQTWGDLLPQVVERLPVVTPPPVHDLAARSAQEIARSLAPTVLVGRQEELTDLDRFSLTSGEGWRWIQAGAFAGKSALLAWFALHPPEGLDVAGCFLVAVQGRNTAEYALGVLNDQLAALARRDEYVQPTHPWQWVSAFRDLLPAAANAARQRRHRLLLLIDGLDEYDAHSEHLDAWLPDNATCPEGVSVLVSSRTDVPVRLQPTHPLFAYVRHISVSDAATELRALAKDELRHALVGEDFRYDIVGYLAAAGGGLTPHDMLELLRRNGLRLRAAEVNAVLEDQLARTVHLVPDPGGLADQVLVFAHDMMRDEARSMFSDDLTGLREELYSWADSYRDRGWPDETPAFLFQGYRQMLRSELSSGGAPQPEVLSRLIALLGDQEYREEFRLRQGWLLQYVRDREFLATVSPEQARDLCYRGFETDFPNSYLRKRLLDLLVAMPPASGSQPKAGRRRALENVVDALRDDPVDLDWLRKRYSKYSPGTGSPVAVALVLGMGRVGGVEAAADLLNIFSSTNGRGQLAWAAAEALITAGQPRDATVPDGSSGVRRIIVEDLVNGYSSSRTDAERSKRLYVLGFLEASEARQLAVAASESPDAATVGWAIRLLASIGASSGDVDGWLGKLAVIAAGTAQPPWRDEWTQKRLIRALQVSALTASQMVVAREQVQRLKERLERESSTRRPQQPRRRALKVAVMEFDRWLHLRDSGRSMR